MHSIIPILGGNATCRHGYTFADNANGDDHRTNRSGRLRDALHRLPCMDSRAQSAGDHSLRQGLQKYHTQLT